MSLTIGHGPLSADPADANYAIEGPAHRIFVEDAPKRLRVRVGGRTVLDSTRAKLLQESNLLPRYYVPLEDLDDAAFVASETTSHCPFKGDATYRTARVGDHEVADLIWTYPDPNAELPVLAGLAGLYLEKLGEDDRVLEEDEVLLGHPHDPYHRVDAQRSSRRVRVMAAADGGSEEVIAETAAPVAVFETGLPARWYVPVADVDAARLRPSETTSVCPYKGVASYHDVLDVDGTVIAEDGAWGYEDPLPEAQPLPGFVCFDGDTLVTEVDGVRLA